MRYITTSDGVSIACWSVGDGSPIVITHNFSLSHAELEWEIPALRRLYTSLATNHQVIRFDPRMGGVSGQAPVLSLEAMCRDVDAVADEFGHDVFAFMGVSVMGPVAVEYAASRPERVSSLILCDPVVAVADSVLGGELRASAALTEATSAEYATEIFAPTWYGPDETDATNQIAAQAYSRLDVIMPAVMSWDVSARLSEVKAPTLVIATTSSVAGDLDQARQLAAAIPHTRFVRIDGRHAPYYADQSAVVAAIEQQLGGSGDGGTATTGLQAVVFTDVVGSTEHTNSIGDAAARDEIRRIESLIGDRAPAYRGRLLKHLGDGSMLVFDSVASAVEFSIEVQAKMRYESLDLRIGLAVGEPIEEDGDIHGAVVNLAARIVAEAEPGRILTSDTTRQVLISEPFAFEYVGSRQVKGFDDAIGLYEVTAESEAT